MALRFRKSKKVAPGTKVNIGKKSAGVSFGNCAGGISFNSKRGVRARFSIPGTGVSFSKKVGGKSRKSKVKSKGGGSSISSAIIAVLILAALIPLLGPIALVLLVIVLVVGVIIYQSAMSLASDLSQEQIDEIRNQIKILGDSVQIVNTSCDLKSVISSYDAACAALQFLSDFTLADIESAGCKLNQPPDAALSSMCEKKVPALNQAIQRAYDGMLRKCASLKTEKGRKNRQMKFFDELNALMPNFPEETRDFTVDFINKNIDDPLTGLEGL